MYKKHRGKGGSDAANHVTEEEQTLRSSAEWPITGEHEIDIGLRRRPAEDFFVKGPIFLSDLIPVGALGGKTVLVWLLILHRATFSKSTWVTLPTYILKEWKISVDAKVDALKRLEQIGMITVRRPGGGYLKVRLNRKSKNGRNK